MIKSMNVSRQYAPLRVCADICFYFYAIAVLSITVNTTSSDGTAVHGAAINLIAPWSLQLLVFFLACFALGFIIVRIERPVPRFILSLLPGLSFLMSPFQPILLMHAAAWVYYIIYMTIGSFEVFLDVYRRRARIMLIIAFLLSCGLIVFHFATDDWHRNQFFGGEEYGLLFFALSVLSLRGMRLSLGAPKKLRAMDSAFVVALPVLLIAAFFILSGAVPVMTAVLKLLTRFLIWLYRLFFPERELPKALEEMEESINEAEDVDPPLKPSEKGYIPPVKPMGGEDPHLHLSARAWFCILIVALVAALVIITVKLLRNKPKSSDKPRLARERIEKGVYEGVLRRKSGETALPANVRQIRKIYRSYLDRIRSLRMKVSPSDTSQDVLDLSSEVFEMPENRTLRELYIAARYGDPKSVTSEQVAEAKHCLSVIEAAKVSAVE